MSKVKYSSASVAGQVSPWCGQPAQAARQGHTKPQGQVAPWPGQKENMVHPAFASTKAKK